MNIEDTKDGPLEPNPFVNQYFVVKVRVLTETDKYFTNGKLVLPKETLLEGESYTKVFRSMQFRDAILKLAPVAKDLWTWIEYGVTNGEDSIKLNRSLFLSKTGYTRQSLTTAIKILCEGQFISKSSKLNWYFINPRLVFYGSRIAKYPNHLKY